MSAGAASNGGKGLFQWPGRQTLNFAELSTAELRRVALGVGKPTKEDVKRCRLAWGYRVRGKTLRNQQKYFLRLQKQRAAAA